MKNPHWSAVQFDKNCGKNVGEDQRIASSPFCPKCGEIFKSVEIAYENNSRMFKVNGKLMDEDGVVKHILA